MNHLNRHSRCSFCLLLLVAAVVGLTILPVRFTNGAPQSVQGVPVEVRHWVSRADSQGTGHVSRSTQSTADPSIPARVSETYGKLPLSFEANQGQTDPRVKFLARGSGYSLFLTPQEMVLQLSSAGDPSRGAASNRPTGQPDVNNRVSKITHPQSSILRMRLIGARPQPRLVGLEELAGKSNYFLGNDPKKWRMNVPSYGKVKYESVYPGIDLVYHGNQRQLEYDFIVTPSVDLSRIRLAFQGVQSLRIGDDGDLVLGINGSELRQRKPYVYQEQKGVKHPIACRYVLLPGTHQVGFAVGPYDTKKALVIDPVLVYSTYLGGSASDTGYALAVDAAGSAYVTGSTTSINFPTLAPWQSTLAGGTDVFVTKLNAAGSQLVYSTYLGGSGDESGYGIAVDSAGNAYVTGSTTSNNFPTLNAFQPLSGGGLDAFVTKLNAAGSQLVYSTYLGGTNSDAALGMAVDAAGNAYVTGYTYSTNFPTANAVQSTFGGGVTDAFITKLSATGLQLVYSTYLGGNGNDTGRSIALDTTGSAYVTGDTSSTNFPTLAPWQPTLGGGLDAFVTKLNAAGSQWVYSTYLGGSYDDSGYSIAVDSAGNAYVTGSTGSGDFPVMNPLQPFRGRDAFVTKLNGTGSQLVYSTYLGGSGNDWGYGIAVDTASGSAYVTGATASTDFPINGFQTLFGGGSQDAFVTKLSPSGSAFIYSTYLGGNSTDSAYGIAADTAGNAYITGSTSSTNFPTANPLQGALIGTGNAFVLKIFRSNTSYSISGRVADSSGRSLVGVTMTLSGTQIGSVQTDASGNYSFGTLEPGGNYTITPSLASYTFGPPSLTLNNLSSNQVANFTGFFSYLITGSVVDTDGRTPLSGVTMTLSGTQTGSVRTDTSGNYSFLAAAGGNYTITPSLGTSYFSPPSRTINNLTGYYNFVNFARMLNYRITGRVINYMGVSLTGVTMTLSGTQTGSVQTDTSGNYSFLAQAGGNYTVTPSLSIYYFSPPSWSFNNLTSDQTAANFTGIQGYSISGRVADASGTGLGAVTLTLSGSQTRSTQTDVSGNYSFVVTAGGTYTVTPSKASSVYTPPNVSFSNLSSNQTANFTSVPLSTTAQITSLSPPAGPVGTSVVIAGANFGATQGTSTIKFNGMTATPTTWSNQSIVVPVPVGATTGPVVVTAANVASNGVTFTVGTLPSLSALSPTAGPVGTTVTITGANFGATQGASTVKFNGVTATPTTWSNQSLVVPVPVGATTGPVVVTVGAAASNRVLFPVNDGSKSALLLVGSATLSSADRAVKARLEGLGYLVTVKTGSASSTSDATGMTVVVISATVVASDVNTKFTNVTVPVVDWEPSLLNALGMTGPVAGSDFGTQTGQTQVSIINASHPMAAGLSGMPTVVSAASTLIWGRPNGNAAAIATLTADATKIVLFGYLPGAVMPGLAAPARRVGLFLEVTTAASLNTNGWQLFDAAINWATGTIADSGGAVGLTVYTPLK